MRIAWIDVVKGKIWEEAYAVMQKLFFMDELSGLYIGYVAGMKMIIKIISAVFDSEGEY